MQQPFRTNTRGNTVGDEACPHLPLTRQHSDRSSSVRPVRGVSRLTRGVRASTLRKHRLLSWVMLARLLAALAATDPLVGSTLSEWRRSRCVNRPSLVSSSKPADGYYVRPLSKRCVGMPLRDMTRPFVGGGWGVGGGKRIDPEGITSQTMSALAGASPFWTCRETVGWLLLALVLQL